MARHCPSCREVYADEVTFCSHCSKALPPAAALPGGAVLEGRYEILSTVKAGAMGCVYKARDTRLDTISCRKKDVLIPDHA